MEVKKTDTEETLMDASLVSMMSYPIYFQNYVIMAEVSFKRKLVNKIMKY